MIYRNLFRVYQRRKNKGKKKEQQEHQGIIIAQNEQEILVVDDKQGLDVNQLEAMIQKGVYEDDEAGKGVDKADVGRIMSFYQKQTGVQQDVCEFIVLQPPNSEEIEEIDSKDLDEWCNEQDQFCSQIYNSPVINDKNSSVLNQQYQQQLIIPINPLPNKLKTKQEKLEQKILNNSIIESEEEEDIQQQLQQQQYQQQKSQSFNEEFKKKKSLSVYDFHENESSSDEEDVFRKWHQLVPTVNLSSTEIKQYFDYDSNPNFEILWKKKQSFELQQLQKIANIKEEVRCKEANDKGGKNAPKDIIKLIRGTGKEMIQQIGKKIISGDFNLATVSFPIKCMIPKTSLQTALEGTTQTNDKIERMKLVVIASLATLQAANSFGKPLNPILGETTQGYYSDGTQIFAEQISHHPPITYFYVRGPQNFPYTYFGYYDNEAKAGLNNLKILNKGKRTIQFENQSIKYNFFEDVYRGSFFGTMKHEIFGKLLFIDEQNHIQCNVIIGKVVFKRPTDYLQGELLVNGKIVSILTGTYLGYLNFDNTRYWDYRFILPFQTHFKKEETLPSDSYNREDLQERATGNLQKAQQFKVKLEQQQREEGKLRKTYQQQLKKKEKMIKKK